MKFVSKLKYTTIKGIVFVNAHKPSEDILFESKYQLKIFENNDKTSVAKIDKKKNSGNICYAVFNGDKLIHESWLFKKKLLTSQLNFKNAYTVGDCYTLAEYGGKGIYTSILRKILFRFCDKQLIIYTDPSNINSVKGILKAGFVKLYSFEMVRFLGMKIKLKRFYD